MGTIFDFNNKIRAVNIKETISKSVEETKDAAVSFVKGQLHYGEDGSGHLLNPKYKSRQYAKKKEAENPIPGFGTPDLFLKGDFTAGIEEVVNASSYSFTIDSTDSKAPKLEGQYGKEIYALNDQNKEYYSTEILKPHLIENLKNQLGL